jgi:O-antigen ligase
LILGLVLSYTRAAWVSLFGAFIFAFILKFRISFAKFLTIIIVGVGVLLFSWDSIIMSLEKNTQDSSSSFSKHIESVSNISTDASNLERINRWNCAIRMFKERPFLGWGPGTYAFQYAPFQRSKEKTIISTNQGDLGNAHSEFLGPLAESGILGILSFLVLMLTVYYKGMQLYYTLEKGDLRNLVFFSLLALTTYFVHGFLNNFLDTDKLAVPFWSFISILVAVDIYHKKEINQE